MMTESPMSAGFLPWEDFRYGRVLQQRGVEARTKTIRRRGRIHLTATVGTAADADVVATFTFFEATYPVIVLQNSQIELGDTTANATAQKRLAATEFTNLSSIVNDIQTLKPVIVSPELRALAREVVLARMKSPIAESDIDQWAGEIANSVAKLDD